MQFNPSDMEQVPARGLRGVHHFPTEEENYVLIFKYVHGQLDSDEYIVRLKTMEYRESHNNKLLSILNGISMENNCQSCTKEIDNQFLFDSFVSETQIDTVYKYIQSIFENGTRSFSVDVILKIFSDYSENDVFFALLQIIKRQYYFKDEYEIDYVMNEYMEVLHFNRKLFTKEDDEIIANILRRPEIKININHLSSYEPYFMTIAKNYMINMNIPFEDLPFLTRLYLFEWAVPSLDDDVKIHIATKEKTNWKIINGIYYHRMFSYYHSKSHAKLKNPSGIKMFKEKWVYCDCSTAEYQKIAEQFKYIIESNVPDKNYPFKIYFRVITKRGQQEIKRFLTHGKRGPGKGQSVKSMSPALRLSCLNDFLSKMINLRNIPRENFAIFGGYWPIGQEYAKLKELMNNDLFFIQLEEFALQNLK
jgi:hypothetical protein